MECKYIPVLNLSDVKDGFNRYIVECKYDKGFYGVGVLIDLIDT